MIDAIIKEIEEKLKEKIPFLTKDKISKMYKMRNPDNPNYKIYGIKMKDIETVVKTVYNKYECSYNCAVQIFKQLIKSNIAEKKFSALYFINFFKKEFHNETLDLFYREYSNHCNTWALCDSTCLKVLGPYLSKKENHELAKSTLEKWSNSEKLWIRRASIVILLKLCMSKRDFFESESFVFNFITKMLHYEEDYIQKSIGWLLKTCSKYKQEEIVKYLIKNKRILPRLILRYASEKLPEQNRSKILKKES